MSLWQRIDLRATVVLDEVFQWLNGADLARAGSTCRLWHERASRPALWRRLLLVKVNEQIEEPCHWRQIYVCAHAPWERIGRTALNATVLNGALNSAGDRLALAATDGSISVWELADGVWHEHWSLGLKETRGWSSATRVQWAPAGHRLLAAGPLALAEAGSAWELLVLRFNEHGEGRIESRARCGAGAAGCWADAAGEAFISLEPLRLAPGLSVTSVWLNAATQETQSEYVGVRSRLFHIFNENGVHVSHAIVVADTCYANFEPIYPMPLMLAAWGLDQHATIGAWPLDLPRPPPLHASVAGNLPERVNALRERALAPPAPDPPVPNEETVRAQCTRPFAYRSLGAAPTGFFLMSHPRPSLWVSTSAGAVVGLAVPNLIPLYKFMSPQFIASQVLHYVQLSVSEWHVASPQGSLSGVVSVWSRIGHRQLVHLRHDAPAAAAFFMSGWPLKLLVLAGNEMHVWKSRATHQSSCLATTDALEIKLRVTTSLVE